MAPFYAVRHIPTGFFLPTTKKGYTTTEPMDATLISPRLHTSHKRANQAMHAWCRGVHKARWEYSDSDSDYYSGGSMYVEEIKIKPMPKRNLADMEVVEVHLHVR